MNLLRVDDEEIMQIIPANPGYQHLRANLWLCTHYPEDIGQGREVLTLNGLATATDEQLFYWDPIVCWALVEWNAGGERARRVVGVGMEDMPTVLALIDEDRHGHIAYLAPDEEPSEHHREEARTQILKFARDNG